MDTISNSVFKTTAMSYTLVINYFDTFHQIYTHYDIGKNISIVFIKRSKDGCNKHPLSAYN